MKLLAISVDYRPRHGGIATCAFEMLRTMKAEHNADIRLITIQTGQTDEERDFDAQGGFHVERIPAPNLSLGSLIPLTQALHRTSKTFSPDAILCFLWFPEATVVTAAQALGVFRNAPCVIMCHGVELLEAPSSLKKRVRMLFAPLKRWLFQKAARVIAVSHFTAGLVESECGLSREFVEVVPNGVSPDVFTPGPRPSYLVQRHGITREFVLVTVCRMEDFKGVDTALYALSSLKDQNLAIKYIVVGSGPDLPRLKALVSSLGLISVVSFADAVPFREVQDYYRLCDCFLLLTRDDRRTPNLEGFGIVFLEAAACEKPSIAARSGGIPDAVEDGVTGWLVEPGNSQAAAVAIAEAITNRAETLRRGQAARARVLRSFTWSHSAGKVWQSLQTLTHAGRS